MRTVSPTDDAVFPLEMLAQIPRVSGEAMRVLLALVAARGNGEIAIPPLDELAESAGLDGADTILAFEELRFNEVIDIDSNLPWLSIPELESIYEVREYFENRWYGNG